MTREGSVNLFVWLLQHEFFGLDIDPQANMEYLVLTSAYGEETDCRFAGVGLGGEPSGWPVGPGGGCGQPGGVVSDDDDGTGGGPSGGPLINPHDGNTYWSPSLPNKGPNRAHVNTMHVANQGQYNGTDYTNWRADGVAAELFAYRESSGGSDKARIKLPAGTVIDFEPAFTTPDGETVWRAYRVVDAWGNVALRTFDSSGRLTDIEYPSGAKERWTWNEAAATGLSRITVTYDLDANATYDEAGAEAAIRWGMEFAHQSGRTRPFTECPLTRIFYPATPFVTAASQSSLFSTTPSTEFEVVEFVYNNIAVGSGPAVPRVVSIHEYRQSSLWGSPGTLPAHFAKFTYSAINARLRITDYEDRFGSHTTYSYQAWYGASSEFVAEAKVTDPRGTVRTMSYDTAGRTIKLQITPLSSTLPRQADSYFSSLGLSEPTSVQWNFVYGSTGCGCAKPIEIQSPGVGGARVEYWTWDSWGHPLTHTYPNPASAASPTQLTDSWTWNTSTSTATPTHSPTLLATHVNQVGTWTGGTTWEAVGSTTQVRVRAHSVTSPTIVSVDGGNSTVVVSREWNAAGWLTKSVDGDGVARKFGYLVGSQDPGTGQPTTITRIPDGQIGPSILTKFTWDELGRLTQATHNGSSSLARVTTFERDALGRLLASQTSVPEVDPFGTSQSVLHRREYLRDRWGNVAVIRERNRNSSDSAPTRHITSGMTARPWIRTDRHFEGDRLVREFVDRRSLDANETGLLSDDPDARMLEYIYTYYPDGTPLQVSLPNGATQTYNIDGYGTLFRTSVTDNGTPSSSSVVRASYFIDAALDVIKVHRGDHAAGLDLWTTIVRQSRSGQIDAIVEPAIGTAPPGYSGSLGGGSHVFTRDTLGRVTIEETYDGSTLLAKTEHEFDQLSRAHRTKQHMLGAGPGGIYETKRRFLGATQLTEIERPGGRITKYVHDALTRVERIEDSLQPTANTVYFDYIAGTNFLDKRRTKLVQDLLNSADTTVEYHTRYSWDTLGRLRKVEDLGAGGSSTPETHAFWYYTSGDTEWYLNWKGSSQPSFGSSSVREQHYMPDALGRLVEHAILGDNGSATTDDIVLALTHADWTDATTCRTRMDRFDGEGNRTTVHRDFADRAEVEQRPGAPSYSPTAISQPHTIAAAYDAASRITTLKHGTPIGGSPLTQMYWDGADRLLVRQFPGVNGFPYHSFMATREVYDRDALGRVTTASTYTGDLGSLALLNAVTWDEDSVGRLHGEHYDFGILDVGAVDIWNVATTFDSTLKDRRDSLTYQGGLQMSLRWDAVGRMAGLDWNPGGSSQLLADYGHFGGQTSWRHLKPKDAASNTFIDTEYQFENYGRMSRITDSRVGTNPGVVDDYQFVYDDFGNLIQELYNRLDGNPTMTNAGDAFYYDRFHRLQEGILGASAIPFNPSTDTFLKKLTYGLDNAGNRETVQTQVGAGSPSTETYTTASNRYTQVQPTIPATLLYDGRGNLIFDGTYLYIFDFKDRLSEIYILVEDEGVAEQTALESPTAFDDQRVRVGLTSPESLRVAREAIVTGLQATPRERQDFRRMQANGALTEPIQLPRGTPIQTSSGVQFSQQSSQAATSLQLVALYGYDGYNRRVGRIVVPTSMTYLHVYDGWREIQELTVNGSTGAKTQFKEFVWGSRLDELVAYRRNDAAPGQTPSWTTYHTTQCGHECVLSVIGSDGALIERAMYDPYGAMTVYSSSESYTGTTFSTSLTMTWKGHRQEAEAPLMYMRNRHYSQALGRFASIDRVGVWDDRVNLGNAYGYAGGSPLVYLDPYGLQGQTRQERIIDGFHKAFLASEDSIRDELGELDSELEPINDGIRELERRLRIWENSGPGGKQGSGSPSGAARFWDVATRGAGGGGAPALSGLLPSLGATLPKAFLDLLLNAVMTHLDPMKISGRCLKEVMELEAAVRFLKKEKKRREGRKEELEARLRIVLEEIRFLEDLRKRRPIKKG